MVRIEGIDGKGAISGGEVKYVRLHQFNAEKRT